MKFNFKKISAIATSLLMTGMSAGIAAAANYPAPFVDGGVGDVAIVYGASALTTDSVAAANIQTELATHVTTTGGTPTTGDFKPLDTSATRIWLNSSLNTAKTTFTKSDLPVVLADYTFSGNVDSKMTSTIKFASGAAAGGDNSGKVIFAKQPSSNNDPEYGISLGSSQTSNPFYNASITFGTAVAFNHTDSEGETIRFFGKDFTVSTATDATNLVLFSSAEEVNLQLGGDTPNPSATVTIAGTQYVIELITGTSTTATLSVNGESKEITEGSSKKIGGIDIAVKSVTESSAIDTIVANVLVGSEKLTFTSGSQVTKGSEDDPIDGTYVYFSGTPNALTGLTISVFRPDSSTDAILKGDTFHDPGFGSFDVYFEGMSVPAESTDRESMSVKNSGDDSVTVSLTDSDGKTGIVEFAHNQSAKWFLANDNNYTLNVIEKANLTENEFVVLGNEDYGHILQLTDIYNQTTGSTAITNDRVRFQDVLADSSGTKETYTTTFSTTEGTGTLTIDGKEYNVTFRGSDDTGYANVKYPTGDSANANTLVVYPTIKTKNGALVSFYEPLTFNFSAPSNDGVIGGTGVNITTLNFPDGNGYTSATIAYGGGNISWAYWTIGGDNFSTGPHTYTEVAGAQPWANVTIGQVTYNFTRSGNEANATTLYVVDPEAAAHANIDNPGLIIFEGKDDQNTYEAIVVDLEGNAASMGTSTNGVGVNDVLFSSTRAHYSATLASDSDHTKDVDYFGTITTLKADDSDQKILEISYPETQTYAKIYIGETAAMTSVSGGLGNVLVKDSETALYGTKNVIVVGGSCINTAAATLVGGNYCEADWTTATGAGAGTWLVKAYPTSTITSKLALLVAGYEAADTTAAATWVTTQTFDTSAVEQKGPVVGA